MIHRWLRAALACVLALTITGCGGGSESDESARPADPAPEAESDAPPPEESPAAASPTLAPLTVEDISRWQKGVAAELEAVRKAGAMMSEARTNEDTLSAMMAVQEMATQEAGAKAAGIDLERYKFVRSELSAAISYLTPHLGGIDTTMLSPAMRDELRQSNQAQLEQMRERVPPELVEALRPRAEALRKQELELVGARLKSAGM